MINIPYGGIRSGVMKKTYRDEKLKKNLINRLNRIEGQIRGIKRMVEEDIYCNDIINQNSAVISAMGSVSNIVLENHLKNCLVKDIGENKDEVLLEVIETIKKMSKR